MAGIKGLLSLAFAGSIGMTLLILSCALPQYNSWWPFFLVLFYIAAVIPTCIAKRGDSYSSTTNACLELSIFLTMGVVISSFALPIVLARSNTIQFGAAYLAISGNVVVYFTILAFFVFMDGENAYGAGI